ncbi:hypothetical protein QVH35_02435 [Candidatus Nitrosotenuis chungbukensis]|uniref:hypothetical protein n=1 Tax=Candidatus Nitrosotenuis chungbukensis TaxID=1353246 RepID=UPI0005B25E91|nr:hypothetical protein [Candidatus Nitrosotenuis chungbukensis]WKT58332.1 hypothetical protein QVH35_02435 [Candidatus Nitrosotenuis chungbukensis]
MKKGLIFRSWYYFRTGWSTYFAFILGAVNTLTVTYYLAIEKMPSLKELFPTFTQYAAIGALIVLPVLTLIGYLHYKKTEGFKAEADITIETNPHFKRILQNSEITIPLCVEILELLTKISQNEKLTDEEINRISKLKSELRTHSTKKTMKLD